MNYIPLAPSVVTTADRSGGAASISSSWEEGNRSSAAITSSQRAARSWEANTSRGATSVSSPAAVPTRGAGGNQSLLIFPPALREGNVTTEITYAPDRSWILYTLFCIMILIGLAIICWFLYKDL